MSAAGACGSSAEVLVVVLTGGAVAGVLELDVSADVDKSVTGTLTADCTTPAPLTCSVDAL